MICATNHALPCDCEKEREREKKRAHQDLMVKFMFELLLLDRPASASELVKLAERKAALFEEAAQIYLSAEQTARAG